LTGGLPAAAHASTGTRPTSFSGASKGDNELDAETKELQGKHIAMEKLFPPPIFEDDRADLIRTFQLAFIIDVT